MSKKTPHKNFSYEPAGKALRKLLLQIAEIKEKDVVPIYKGPDIESSSVLATNQDIKTSFIKESIEWNKDKGRDKIDTFILKVFQLGYSVGYTKGRESGEELRKIVGKLLKEKI